MLEQVFALIQRVLSLKHEQFDSVNVDALIDQMGRNDQDPSQVEAMIDFIRDERRLIDKLRKAYLVESQFLKLGVLSKEWLTLLSPLQKMIKIELDFLLDMEMDYLRPLDHQRWSTSLLNWCRFANLYRPLIRTESRNKRLLRNELVAISTNRPSSYEAAILECLELVLLPSLSLRFKLNFMQVCEVALTYPAVYEVMISVADPVHLNRPQLLQLSTPAIH